jgi:hypothetical protein
MKSEIRSIIWSLVVVPFIRFTSIIYDVFAYFRLKKNSRILLISSAGLGDHLLLADLYIEISTRYELVLLVEEKHLDLVKALVGDSKINLISVPRQISNQNYFEKRRGEKQIAKELNSRRLYFSTDFFSFLNFLRPDYPPIAHCFRLFGVNSEIYLSGKARQNFRMASTGKILIPQSKFVITDNFLGTDREIPESVLVDIRNRGFEVINNPQDFTYLELVDFLESASELHLTNSSLFCLALLLNLSSPSKNLYLKREGVLHSHEFAPFDWNELALRDPYGNTYLPPKRINRELVLKEIRAKRINRVKKKLYEKIMDLVTKSNSLLP